MSTYRFRIVRRIDPRAIEQEPHARGRLTGPLAEGVHEFLELGRALDLEEDLVVAIGDLDVEVFALAYVGTWRSVW